MKTKAKNKRKHHDTVLWNNIFVNPMRLPFLCEKTGAVALVQLSLTYIRQADEMLLSYLKNYIRITIKNQETSDKLAV